MKFTAATWNVRRHKSSAVWNQLTPNPDVFLLQETSVSEDESTSKKVFGSIIGGNRKWGSAIATQKYELKPIKLEPDSHPGAVVVADIMYLDKPLIRLISLYGLMQSGYSITTLHRMLSDLTPLIDNYARKNVILAGDFNASLQWDERQPNKSHKILFARIQDFGFVDCLAHYHSYPIQTWRKPNDITPWQLDYFYASKPLFDKLKSCNVVENTFSDHHPIVAVFDL